MYTLLFRKDAQKYIQKLDVPTRKRIRDALIELAEDPYNDRHVVPIVGISGLYRKRIGDFRVLFEIIEDRLVIEIIKVASRGDVYKNL